MNLPPGANTRYDSSTKVLHFSALINYGASKIEKTHQKIERRLVYFEV